MTAAAQLAIGRARAFPGWLPAVLLLATMALAGPQMGSVARPAFLLGSLLAGWWAWQVSPAAHLQAALALFTFAPFVRRLVDVSAGFDPGGLMIAGPFLALLAPLPELRRLALPSAEKGLWIGPYMLFLACVVYSTELTIAQGNWQQAASGALKWAAPVLYALALYRRRPDPKSLLHGLAAAFAIILPITGLYGIYQYIDPPLWDRYWLIYAQITSAGRPFPYEVRTFSTMHGPGVFATFTAAGVLLVYILRPYWRERLMLLPAVLALVLSLYRTAWISLAAGILFCALFGKTRANAGGAVFVLIAAVTATLLFTPFGDSIAERFSTFGDASNDGSGQERLQEFATLWNSPGGETFGNGFNVVDTGAAGAAPIDGMIAACWYCMGIAAGLICISTLVYMGAGAIALAWGSGGVESTALGALAVGWLIQLPLAGVGSSEIGFLFWSSMTLALCMRTAGAKP
jgi:hypothetical protein